MSKDPKKIALIGVGNQGKKHLSSLKRLHNKKEIDLIGICDIQFEQNRDNGIFSSYESLLKQQPDIVIISTPNYLHKQITIEALRNGADVIKEKPFAVNLNEAKSMYKFSRSLNKTIATMQQRFYSPIYIKAKEIIEKLGQPKKFFYQLSLNDSNQSWYWSKNSGGGTWLNLGWHAIYLINWLIDEIVSVKLFSRNGGSRKWDYDVDHTSIAKIKTKKGITGTILVSSVSYKEEYFKIDFEDGSIYVFNDLISIAYKGKTMEVVPEINKNNIYDSQIIGLINKISEKSYEMENDLDIMKIIQQGFDSSNAYVNYENV